MTEFHFIKFSRKNNLSSKKSRQVKRPAFTQWWIFSKSRTYFCKNYKLYIPGLIFITFLCRLL